VISSKKKRLPASSEDTKWQEGTEQPTIYDLVAGMKDIHKEDVFRQITGRVRLPISDKSLYRGERYTRTLTPAEHYFTRLRPKTGDEDEDSRIYWSPETDKHELPSSDLLWAIHRYVSQKLGRERPECVKFMDETALIAMGILLEESIKESIGTDGYLSLLIPGSGSESEDERVAIVDDEFSSETVDSDEDEDSSEDKNQDNDSEDELLQDATDDL
jgi:hypothetical protein